MAMRSTVAETHRASHIAAQMVTTELHHLRFASEATTAALWGTGFLLLAALAWWGDHRRVRRRNFDRVGWMPWTKLFFASLLIGGTLMMMALQGWISGGA